MCIKALQSAAWHTVGAKMVTVVVIIQPQWIELAGYRILTGSSFPIVPKSNDSLLIIILQIIHCTHLRDWFH